MTEKKSIAVTPLAGAQAAMIAPMLAGGPGGQVALRQAEQPFAVKEGGPCLEQ
mgnify:CR=1 FL=1